MRLNTSLRNQARERGRDDRGAPQGRTLPRPMDRLRLGLWLQPGLSERPVPVFLVLCIHQNNTRVLIGAARLDDGPRTEKRQGSLSDQAPPHRKAKNRSRDRKDRLLLLHAGYLQGRIEGPSGDHDLRLVCLPCPRLRWRLLPGRMAHPPQHPPTER